MSPLTVVLAVGALALHLAFAEAFYSNITRLCAGLEAATLVLLSARYVAVRPPRLPWVEAAYALFYTEFGLAVTVDPPPMGLGSVTPSTHSHEAAAILALACGYALIVAFAITAGALKGRLKTNPLLPRLDPDTLAAGASMHVFVAATYVILASYSPALHQTILVVANFTDGLFSSGPLIVVSGIAFLTRPGVGTRFRLILAISAIAAGVAVTSMLSNAVLPLATFTILWWRARERVPFLPIAAGIAALVILQPVKAYYRDIQWTQHADMGVIDAWTKAFENAEGDKKSGFTGQVSGSEATRKRLNELTALAYVYDVVPLSVPYGGGEVYGVLGYSLVPRLLWPEKPNMTKVGLDRFGIALGLTDRDLAETSTTGLTLPSQGYYEHGIAGSLGWMALLGLSMALFSTYFGATLAGTLAGATTMMTWLIGISGGFFNTFGGMWQAIFTATFLSWTVWWLGKRVLARGPRPSLTTRRLG